MKKTFAILIFVLLTISLQAKLPDGRGNKFMSFSNATPQSKHEADSIMKYVIDHANLYANAISKYQADIYIKGRTEILKQNWLILFAHHIFPVDRKKPDMIFEMVSHSEFEAPNLYHHDFKAVNGNGLPNTQKQQEILTFLNLNIYSPTIYDEAIITPVCEKAFRYYEFNLESVEEINEGKTYKIRFLPKQWSQKLVSGDLYIRQDEWRIEKIEMNGRFDFAEFNIMVSFGHVHGQLILPSQSTLALRYKVLGNAVISTYHSSFKYNNVEWKENLPTKKKKREWKDLDLTQYYTLSSDSIPFIQNEEYWKEKRDVPLTKEEEAVYQINYLKPAKGEPKDSTATVDYLKLGERLTNSVNYDFESTRIRYSGLLNPLQFGYSSRNGITYKQKLRITKSFPEGKQLILRPEIGYMFKTKEVFFKAQADWQYKPEKKGSLQLTIANDNQSYSSQMMNTINEHLKDSLFDFNDLNLDYYRHYYIDLKNTIEISNGFQFDAGLSFHSRNPVKKKQDVDPGGEVEDLIHETFYDFTPEIGFTYTPRQFYRMNGKKKEYVYSYYPTFSMVFARGIPGILGSSGNYGRVEVDINQRLNLGLLRHFSYHASAGIFTRQKSIYFADFKYFTSRNFPESWEERIGGVFHTLKREWFNASDKYLQTHLMYESPFILMSLLHKKASKHILSERLYLGQVWTPALPSYTEIGYGFGNAIFNIGVFAGFSKLEFQRFALRFTFEFE